MAISISASLVKELRERTSAGMMECERALEENQGDIEKAVQYLREKGQSKADKKADRIAAEGIITACLSTDRKRGVLLEINCETDFVARSEDFIAFAKATAEKILQENIQDLNAAMALKLDSGETIEETRQVLIGKLGENIQLRRFDYKTTDYQLMSYVHTHRIGVLVEIEGGDEILAKDIALHVAASQPLVIHPKDVPENIVQKEKEIFTVQASTSGKPANIIEKMIDGRIQKFLDEMSLLGQAFVKSPDETVGQLLSRHQAKVHSFTRFAVGEGIEKKVSNFAEEVMAQVHKSS